MRKMQMYTALFVLVAAFIYFIWRPMFTNEYTLPDSNVSIQTEFGFCHQLFGTRASIRSELVPIKTDGPILRTLTDISTSRQSCIEREGLLFGFFLPRRVSIYVDMTKVGPRE